MAAADPNSAGLDPAHILAVCERVAADGGHKPVGYVTAAPEGVRLRLGSARTAQEMQPALTRAGYQTELVRPGRRWRLLVTGWSADGLQSRLAAMRATILQLRSAETAAAKAVIDRYRDLSARLPGAAASAAALSEAEQEIRVTVAARCGMYAPRDPAILPSDVGKALPLRTIWALEQAIGELIERHMRVARRAVAQFCSLRRHGSDDWAKDVAVRRASEVPPAPAASLPSGPPTKAPRPLPPRPDAAGRIPEQASHVKPDPGQRAGLDFPAPVTDAAAAAARVAPASGRSPARPTEGREPGKRPRWTR